MLNFITWSLQVMSFGLDFSEIAEESETVNQAELLKFFKDFGVVPRLISKKETESLFKVANSGTFASGSTNTCDYTGMSPNSHKVISQ